MKKIRFFAIVLFVIIFSMAIVACSDNSTNNVPKTETDTEITENGLTLQLKDDNTYAIISCDGRSANLTIPEMYNGIAITSISTGSFENCSGITHIFVSNSVTDIERGAFRGCTGLIEITIPYVDSRFGLIFSPSDESINNDYVPTSLKKVTITNETVIPYWAFAECRSLESIILPDTLTKIGNFAFENCTSLDEIIIPPNVVLSDSNGWGILIGCHSISSITLPAPEEYWSIAELFGASVYDSYATSFVSYSLKSINFSKISEITSYTFNRCKNVSTVTLPSSLQKIEDHAFWFGSSYDHKNIYYQGTKAEWLRITKEDDWDEYAGEYTIHCTDGTITKD